MTKRKRESFHSQSRDTAESNTDFGLGATLAHLKGDDNTTILSAPSAPDSNKDDDEGWTTVGSNKRRRQQRMPDADNTHGSTRRSPSADRQVSGEDAPEASDRSKIQDARKERRKERKLERHYPSIRHSNHARLNGFTKISDLQSLALYVLADGVAPQWCSVQSRESIRQVVVLMVPGLDLDMFRGNVSLNSKMNEDSRKGIDIGSKPKRIRLDPDDYYPAELNPERLQDPLKPLSEMFQHVWPVNGPVENRGKTYMKLHSPIHAMLSSQIPRTREEKQLKKSGNHKGPLPQNTKHWQNKHTPVTDYLASLADQQENEYVPHPAWFLTDEAKKAAHERRKAAQCTSEDGWVDSNVSHLEDAAVSVESTNEEKSPDLLAKTSSSFENPFASKDSEAGDRPSLPSNPFSVRGQETERATGPQNGSKATPTRRVLAVDCEMCKDENDNSVLTRISLVDWDGNVVMDKLVKPDTPIKDYVTQYSGITEEMLRDITTTLADIQKELLEILTPQAILVGHSLNSDLNALKLTHPFVIDTGMLYPHIKGPPYKQSLKWLTQKFLNKDIQKGASGHDSIEDARACLELVKQKCERGPGWGTSESNTESIFKRLQRAKRPKSNNSTRASAMVDWGNPTQGPGAQANVSIGCDSDMDIVSGIQQALSGHAVGKSGATEEVDFVFARLRELELVRGWWDDGRASEEGKTRRRAALERLGLPTDWEQDGDLDGETLGKQVSKTIESIAQIYESLPKCTAFIVYSGTGDPREVRRLRKMHDQHKAEYATKNWDQLSVKWTDTEVQALSKAVQVARSGVALITVK